MTGSSRGIGAATALMLAADGWPVRVNYRSDEAGAKEVVAQIEAAGGTATLWQGDVADADDIERLVEPGDDGPVLVLVNNAGVRMDGLSPQLDDEQWQTVIDTNLTSTFRATRAALPKMMRARFGRVINVASVAGHPRQPRPGQLLGLEGGRHRLHQDRRRRGGAARRHRQRGRPGPDRDRLHRGRARGRHGEGDPGPPGRHPGGGRGLHPLPRLRSKLLT